MASTRRGSYPHPVLDSSDDVGSDFEIFNSSVTPAVDDVQINFQLRMTDPTIKALIDDGRARYSFRWKCGSTVASEELAPQEVSQHADSTGYVAWIAQEDIRRAVRVELKIVATAAISPYRLANQHPDYDGAHFNILPGDILADGGFLEFEPDKLYDPLSPPVGSCFKFVAEPKLSKGLRVRFHDDEYVLVEFPEKVFLGLAALGSRPDLQISLVVLPALMQAISFIKENLDPGVGEDLADMGWYRAIRGLVEKVGSFDDPTIETAQKILANPLDTSLLTPFRTEDDD